jgi:hypothetical protein
MTPARPEPEHVHLLLGVYTFGIVSRDEAELVERHLAGCAGCRDEHRELAAVLPFLALLANDDPRSIPDPTGPGTATDRDPDRPRRRPRIRRPPPVGRPRQSPGRPPGR